MQHFYEQLFGDMEMPYKRNANTIYSCEQFVVNIDDDYDDDDDDFDKERKYDDEYECEEVKVVDVGCEEHKVEIDPEISNFVNMEMQKWMFELYSEWYQDKYFGTLEHPIVLHDDKGEILRAVNYYNYKAMSMVEMKLIMYGEQVENMKKMLSSLGFQFDKIDMSQFGAEETSDNGSVNTPYMLYDDDGDMYYVYNCYTTKEDDKMYEMRVIFDSSQLAVVKSSLKAGGFVVF